MMKEMKMKMEMKTELFFNQHRRWARLRSRVRERVALLSEEKGKKRDLMYRER